MLPDPVPKIKPCKTRRTRPTRNRPQGQPHSQKKRRARLARRARRVQGTMGEKGGHRGHAKRESQVPTVALTLKPENRTKTTPDVPFVNRPFESEIHGIVNFTQFCCVLLVTWCYRVLLSCYLRPK